MNAGRRPRGSGREAEQPQVHVGILGKGTVRQAFADLLEERAAMVEEVSGKKPKLTGVLSTKKGDFDEILPPPT